MMMQPMFVTEDRLAGDTLYYPIDIVDVKDRPILHMTCMVPNQGYTNIYFPMPEGVQINDAMSYNNQDLNILGYAAQQITRAGSDATNILGGVESVGKSLLEMGSKLVPGSNKAALATISAAAIDDASIKAGIASVTQMSFNKNAITTFDGIGIRTHGFTFKLIARSPEESEMIKKIQFVFRSGMYPVNVFGQEDMVLHFPPKWKIQFVSLPTLDPLLYLPQPYECYLQNLSTNFNASSKMWRKDKAPLEVDITVSFVETKALTMSDIKDLQYGFSADDFNSGEQDFTGALKERGTKYVSKLANILQANGSIGSGIGQTGYTGGNPGGNSSVISEITKFFQG